MEYNKSLSARIRRRNKQGFKGEGTTSGFVPTNLEGDYITMGNRENTDKYRTVKNFLRKRGHKHTGSMSARTLKQYM